MSGFTAVGISVTTVSTAAQGAQAPLGFVLTVPNGNLGNQEWVYVEAAETLTKGFVASRDPAAATTSPYKVFIGDAASTQVMTVGVAQHTITAASFGFVLKSGVGTVLADGNVIAGTGIQPVAGGEVGPFAGTHEDHVIGMAMADDAGTGATDFVDAVLDCGF